MNKLSLRQHWYIYTVILAICIGLTILSVALGEPGNPHFTFWLAIALIVVSTFYRATFIKCPDCGDGLYKGWKLPDRCPNCGKYLHSVSAQKDDENEKADR